MRCDVDGRMHPNGRPRVAKAYRGSLRRVRRIRLRTNGSWELWVLIAWVAFLLLIVVPWMARQTH